MDLSLQANPAVPEATEVEPAPEPAPPAAVAVKIRKSWRKLPARPSLHMAVAALWIVALVLLNIGHKPIPRRAMGDQLAPIPVAQPELIPADYQQSADDELPEPAESAPAAQMVQPAAKQPHKEFHFNETTARLAAESGAPYLPLIAW
jgi:hypothetical protein